MQSMLEVFIRDAQEDLRKLSTTLPKAADEPKQVREVQRLGRRIAYNARLAQQKEFAAVGDAIYDAASRALGGVQPWTEKMSSDVAEAAAGLTTLIRVIKSPPVDFEHRVRTIGEKLRAGLGVPGAAGPAAPIPTVHTNPPELAAKERAAGAAGAAGAESARAEGRADAQNLVAVVTELRDAVERLERDPRDREPLKAVLRKVRPIRRLPELAAVDSALSAVEEIILSIAEKNATVGPAHLTLFGRAREAVEEALRAIQQDATLGGVVRRGDEIERLKAKILETARRAHPVVWVTELFFEDDGPHVLECPKADQARGGRDGFFREEASVRLGNAEELRKKMASSGAEAARLAGESLSSTLRTLRERAVAFGHRELGRIARRAAAAVRAQLVRPPDQIHALAKALAETLTQLRAYVTTADAAGREQALQKADAALELAIVGGGGASAPEGTVEGDEALRRALSLRSRIDEHLKRISGPEAEALRQTLEELFELLGRYLSSPATP
jgi:hypothetical protein